MITFTSITLATPNELQFVMTGDGVATVLVINLSKPPFSVNFGGAVPSAALVSTRTAIQATAALALSGADVVITVTFNSPPPVTPNTGLVITFNYNSL